ncbi:MAG: bifunctional oligoribonuclease/PAP phosphatase NrnA [Bacteroidales bacterium]|nr:bifunctional oligoribonuclease/PAP phosphatase NrnA [Bacteroidales bacterium]
MTNSYLQKLNEVISGSNQILIITHFNPDGDAIGSTLALHHYLAARGKKTAMLVPNAFPEFLSFLHGSERIVIFDEHPLKAKKLVETADLVFCVDLSALNRLKEIAQLLQNSAAPRILVDHHPDPEDDFTYKISRIEVSSTSELIYELIIDLGDEKMIDKKMAECLFVGIMTDTGSFSFSCNYPSTFRIVSNLLETGINAELIHQKVYDTFSEDRLRLLGFCLSEKLVVLKDYGTAYIALSRHDLEYFNFKPGDTEGVVNYALSIKGIVFAALFTEKDDIVRISFRSKGDFSVNDFARTHFNGGGHKNAAGADSYKSLDETLSNFITILYDHKEQLQLLSEIS